MYRSAAMEKGGATILFGGSGFLGPIILELYPKIISVGRSRPAVFISNRHVHIDDIGDLSVLNSLDVEKVIFMIGNSNHHFLNATSMAGIEYNFLPLKKALYYFSKRSIRKFIAFSTILLYDVNKIRLPVDESQPINPYINEYVFSKYVAEEVTKLYRQVPVINIRLSNIYGPTKLVRPDLVPTLIQEVFSPHTVEVWSVKPERDFIYVKDAAHAIVRLLDTDYVGHLNLGTGKMNSVGKVVEIIERLSEKKIKVLNKPVNGPMQFVCDISLVSKLTGWKPSYTLEQGLSETFSIMKTYATEGRWLER